MASVEGKRENVPFSKLEKKRKDDERRKLSLANKSREKQKQSNLIRSALSSIDAPKAKKIVFGSDDEEIPEEKKQSLFDDEEEVDSFDITEKEHFEGEKGRKLLKLQSQFNNDDRFKMDERFLDDDTGKEESAKKIQSEMVRFDPTKRKASEETNPVKTKRKKSKTVESIPEVSKERFFEVSDSLTAAFKEKSSGFSLLAAYSNRNDNKSNEIPQEEQVAETKIKPIKKRNPMLVESSDEEEVIEDEPKIWAPVVHIPAGPRDNFFFSKNDPLISEAMEFLNKKNSDEAKAAAENYDSTRRMLKKLFKDQAMKRSKQNDMFKKKIGGMKKNKPVKRNPFIQSSTNGKMKKKR